MTIETKEMWTQEAIEARRVSYSELRPCYNAFIDTRTPGSERKENFTIIGPGVSENPDQHVHISEPHGFNIGGARQPPACVNSQHSHKTAEVFVVHSGTWRFDLGEFGDDAQVTLNAGDVISIPTDIFRGFTNVGDDIGFLWAVLGEDDPGRVTWAPSVFELAKEYGLVLLKSGNLVDTLKGQSVPDDDAPMPPTSAAEASSMHVPTQAEAEALVWRSAQSSVAAKTNLIGPEGKFSWSHGFTLERFELAGGSAESMGAESQPTVIFIQRGRAFFNWERGRIELLHGDTFSVPRDLPYSVSTQEGAEIFVVRNRQNG